MINVWKISTPSIYCGPAFDATTLEGKIVTSDDAMAPLLLIEFTDKEGKKVRLRDYGTAGQNGTFYCSWLDVQKVKPEPFSETNPLRSSRYTKGV
jgi:hypothetical protein